MAQPSTDQIHVLVVVPEQEPPVNPPQIFPTYRPNAEGIDLDLPHLSRDELVQKLYSAITGTNFVLLSSPAGSGKTSLLTLFARQYPGFRYVPIAFDSATADATMILSSHGVDICGKKCVIPRGELCVFMMDDCQRQYKDLDFWTGLIKGSSSWLPKHVRFIISATHLLETDAPISPVAFSSIPWKLAREDFLISDVEAHTCLALENGLPPSLRHPTFLEVIIRECNRHIGSLRVSINTIYAHFQKGDPTEHDLLAYYMSGAFVDQMARCFGSDHTTPTHPEHRKFLTLCLVGDPAYQPLVQKLSHDEEQYFTRLKKAGIVFEDGGYVKFTSPLAERYYYKWLFPVVDM
ncbi:hypothetical protein PHYPSEUDO_000460 [Phytophthora pseudosyringae]|uniref:Uncharacterized protein n=1 Tax=Phytophthora pseudosyringae TaxID=221518 RepID=A0A8T1V3W2_9STRA|nr:hypothetical protein PHYPSEUDO_000460 [Phytophthora pseudosyringae]